MKKISAVISVVALSSLIVSPLAIASSNQLIVELICPPSNALSSYQRTIIGDGTETVYTSPVQISHPTFTYVKHAKDVLPNNLSEYQNQGVVYNSNIGSVSCHYGSNNFQYTPIDLSYRLMNAKGGLVQNVTANSIVIVLPVALNT